MESKKNLSHFLSLSSNVSHVRHTFLKGLKTKLLSSWS